MVKQHIIELNGKRYDTLTGKTVTSPPNKTNASSKKTAGPKSLDGFSRPPRSVHRHDNSLNKTKPQKSQTLMRRGVQKPTSNHTESLKPKKVHAVAKVSPVRLAHADKVPKSKLVSKFGSIISAPSALATDMTTKIRNNTAQAFPAVNTLATQSRPIAENAIASATSHHQPKIKRPAPHIRIAQRLRISPGVLSGGTFILAGLLLAGFFTYQNIPNLNMRLASARAGVHGNLPGYKPAGFGLHGGISYKPGQITVSFKSTTDDRNFRIIQTSSNWNSDSLRENYETLKTSSSRIEVPDKGKTVFIYNGSNATWVDGGVWYRIEGDSRLNSSQLLSIANSM